MIVRELNARLPESHVKKPDDLSHHRAAVTSYRGYSIMSENRLSSVLVAVTACGIGHEHTSKSVDMFSQLLNVQSSHRFT